MMGIPKTIHYCWFGRNPLPKLAQKCIKSWKKHCPDYEIIQWNEDNYDISAAPLYVRQAYESKKWAFVTDYVRLQIVYEHGGIYLDTDVEVVKSFNSVLGEQAFFGMEYGAYVATGLGFGAEKHSPVLKEMMRDYENVPFISEDGTFDLLPCPVRNSRVLFENGLKAEDVLQKVCGATIFPGEYLCPYDGRTGLLNVTGNTLSIHWYSGSWIQEEDRQKHRQYLKKIKRQNAVDFLLHLPNHIGMKLLGKEKYERLKRTLKGK